MRDDDETLVRSVAAGSDAALAELLRRHERALSAFISRYTGGADVEDLYQETWLRVVGAADRFDPRRRFKTWLYQIAVNLCRDRARRASRPIQAGLAGAAGSAGLADPAEAATAASDRIEQRIDAIKLLARLSDAHREVIILRYYHDMSETQIAEILDCPQGTVKSRIHAALANLMNFVREESGE